MPLRIITITASVLLHALIGFAIWPRLIKDKAQVFDLGSGQDIILMPQGETVSEISNSGDAVQSLETREVITVKTQEVAASPATATPQQLSSVDDDVEIHAAHEIAGVEPQGPTIQSPVFAPLNSLPDVIASEQSVVQSESVKPAEPPPDDQSSVDGFDIMADEPIPPAKIFSESKIASVDQKASPDPLAEEKTIDQGKVLTPGSAQVKPLAPSSASISPGQLTEPMLAKVAPPSPIELKQPEIAPRSDVPPPNVVEEQKPEVKKVQAEPLQVAIVSERSEGEARLGGDAQVVGLYLRKINEQVQRAKINPRTQVTGTVVLKFKVATDGSLLSMVVVATSGSQALDGAAIESLYRAAPFPAIPPEVSSGPMTLMQPFKFVIR